MAASTKLLFLLSAVFFWGNDGAVLELDEKFMDVKGQGMWLVEFYAPWCGHCKKLEPIYHQVALALRSSSIHVAKVDCTRYSSIASEFNVRGFPTIKFISGENVYTHRGERSKEDIVEFAIRAKGPAVRKLSSIGKFNEAKGDHSDGVFFLYIGDEDAKADLYIKYCDLAQKYLVASYFYNGTSKILPKDIKLKNYPTVLVFKDGLNYEYEAPEGISTKASLEEWIVGERLTAFPLISGGTLNEIADINKLIVILTIDTENKEEKTQNNRVKDMGEVLAKQHRETFHKWFQFVWMSDPEAVNSITMWSLSSPSILVLDPATHLYYLPSADPASIMLQDLKDFLLGVKQGSIQAHGGTGFFQRLKRVFYDLFTMVLSVWTASRWLFLLMFGLPTAIISIVCYSLCCMEPADDDGMDSDEEDDHEGEISHQKQGEITSEQQGQITYDSDKSHGDHASHPKSD